MDKRLDNAIAESRQLGLSVLTASFNRDIPTAFDVLSAANPQEVLIAALFLAKTANEFLTTAAHAYGVDPEFVLQKFALITQASLMRYDLCEEQPPLTPKQNGIAGERDEEEA